MRSFTIAQSNQKTQGFPNARNNNKNRDHSIFLKTSCNVKKKNSARMYQNHRNNILYACRLIHKFCTNFVLLKCFISVTQYR